MLTVSQRPQYESRGYAYAIQAIVVETITFKSNPNDPSIIELFLNNNLNQESLIYVTTFVSAVSHPSIRSFPCQFLDISTYPSSSPLLLLG